MKNSGVRGLNVYQTAFSLAMEIFRITKLFPKEETYSLTDQVRRSSRSVCANLSEAYARRSYPRHFCSKLNDVDAELSETITWILFAKECRYIDESTCSRIIAAYEPVGRMIHGMIQNPEKFALKINPRS